MRTFLPTAEPFDGAAVLSFLAVRAIAGVEEVRDGTYRRTLALPGGGAVLALTPRADGVEAELALGDLGDEAEAVRRARALFGLDIDPDAVLAGLGDDPVLGPLVRARPGLRVPGVVDGWELVVRAVLGQQITVVAARGLAGRFATALGATAEDPEPGGTLSRLFPSAEAFADAPDELFRMSRSRARTLRELALAHPSLAEPDDAAALAGLWGIGPWTTGYVALRLGDPDVFLPGDVAVQRALRDLGATVEDAPRWAPWRSAAVLHLWASLTTP
jgi:AraC family transcriptional regulator of adaptative response / DNA-3-methyladenine glycosylase II